KSDENRITLLPNVSPMLNQNSYNEEVDISHLVRGGLDYSISSHSTLGIYAQGTFGGEEAFEDLHQRSLRAIDQLDSLYVSNSTEAEANGNLETSITYTLNMNT